MLDITKFPRGVPGRDLASNVAANARWANPALIAAHDDFKYKAGKVFVGSLGNQMVGISDNRHMMTVAGSRAGKGVSSIIPNLIHYPGSVLVIDPKGENAQITANQRGSGSHYARQPLGQEVFVLDPFHQSGHKTSCFNPLDMLKLDSETVVDDAALIAEALVVEEHGDNRYFSSAARNFLRGLILYVCTKKRPEERNLNTVRELLTLDSVGFKLLLAAMQESDQGYGVIQRAANSMTSKADKELASVLSTATENTDFLDSPPMRRILGRSDFRLGDLKKKPTTLYLCLPARFMATHSRWLRVIVNLAVAAMEIEPTKKDALPVLFIMDEFAVLDHLSSIEKAAGQIAGFGVKLWPILQDLSQLKSIYKDRWETFMGNAGVLQFFGNNDTTTLDYISHRLGKSTIVQVSQSETTPDQRAKTLTGQTTQMHTTELMTGDEISLYFSAQEKTQVILWPGYRPIALERVEYHAGHPFFAGRFDPPHQRS